MTTTATPGREELVHSVSHLLAGHSFALITGGHHEEMASKIVDRIAERLAAKPADEGLYLVWSNQHRAWWRPKSAGYTDDVKRAGRYSRAEAISISFRGRDGWGSPKDIPDELAIAERDVPAFTVSVSTTGEPKR